MAVADKPVTGLPSSCHGLLANGCPPRSNRHQIALLYARTASWRVIDSAIGAGQILTDGGAKPLAAGK